MKSHTNGSDLWASNTTQQFWKCQPDLPEDSWQEATRRAVSILQLPEAPKDFARLAALTLGEKQFDGQAGGISNLLRMYYIVKPLLPRKVINFFKKKSATRARQHFRLNWPIEDRYSRFLWEALRQVLILNGCNSTSYKRFWPGDAEFAFVLTHDIETGEGQKHVEEIANVDARYGFRSSFNFVPERYPLDWGLMETLRDRGFEVGVHGLKHDGKLFNSKVVFYTRAKRINEYFGKLKANGFRAPMMHRNASWMQALQMEYDLSFFDTDPFEPQPGGCMSIWPFRIGRFMELPYTLVQDSTLYYVLGEKTPDLWLKKMAFLREYHGMALLNSHPDFLIEPNLMKIYEAFLDEIRSKQGYWNALPIQAARWWMKRTEEKPGDSVTGSILGKIVLDGNDILLKSSDKNQDFKQRSDTTSPPIAGRPMVGWNE